MDFSLIVDLIAASFSTFIIIVQSIFEHFVKDENKSLKGKRVLLTCAASPLGKEFSLQLSKEGCNLIIIDTEEKPVKEISDLVNSITPNSTKYLVADISKVNDVKKLQMKIKKDIGEIDILINTPDVVTINSVIKASDEEIDRTLSYNLLSNFWLTRQFLPDMLERNQGHIVSVSSSATFTCAPNVSVYTASKYGSTGFMACLREELRKKPNCKVNTTLVHPFFERSGASLRSFAGDVSVTDTVSAAISGIKEEKEIVNVPSSLFFMLHSILLMPQHAADMWRDMFNAKAA